MPLHEIERDQWLSFCQAFSEDHEGWQADLRLESRAKQLQELAVNTPFTGLDYDDDADELLFEMGDQPDEHFAHIVAHPYRLWLDRADDGADLGVIVEDANNQVTSLRFREAMRGDEVGGIAMERE